MWTKTALVGAVLLLVPACTQDATPEAIENSEACEAAVAQVGEAVQGEATPEDMAPAFEECASMDDFSEFVQEDFPNLMGDMEPEEFVREQCTNAEELVDTQLCQSL